MLSSFPFRISNGEKISTDIVMFVLPASFVNTQACEQHYCDGKEWKQWEIVEKCEKYH